MRALHVGPNLQKLRTWTFAALALFDVTLYFDWALRWERGFGFLWRSEWQIWTVTCVGAWLLCVAWLVREGAGFVRHFGLTFLAFSYGCFVASSGNPGYEWKDLPFYDGLYRSSNIGHYARDGGLDFAILAALAHGLLGRSLAKHHRWPAPWSWERWVGAVGVAYLWLGIVLDERLIYGPSVQRATATLMIFRTGLRIAALVIGGLLTAASIALFVRRALWLRRARAGNVEGYRIEDAPLEGRRALATLWPLPRKWFGKVLVQIDARGARPVALVTPLSFGKTRKSRIGA